MDSNRKEGKVAGRVAGQQGNLPSLGVQGMLLEGDICLTVPIWRPKHEAAASVVLFINRRVPSLSREREVST